MSDVLIATTLGMLSYPFISNQVFAQSNVIILLLAMVMVMSNTKLLEGVALGAAVMTKPFAGVFVAAWLSNPVVIASGSFAALVFACAGEPIKFMRYLSKLPYYANFNFEFITYKLYDRHSEEVATGW